MSKVPLCSLTVENLTPAEKEELLSAIKLTSVQIQSEPERVLGVDDVAGAIVLLGVVAQLAEQSIKVAKAIIKWRRDRKKAGKKITGKLQPPGRPPLNLETATDEEIEEWLSHK